MLSRAVPAFKISQYLRLHNLGKHNLKLKYVLFSRFHLVLVNYKSNNSQKMTSPFTCITCRVAFADLEIQRAHYKSDWHRYNLKRKVAELPSVTAEDFQIRVIAQQGKLAQLQESQSSQCKICKKSFSSKNQYENHLHSKKHIEKISKLNGDSDENSLSVKKESSNGKKVEIEVDSDVESVDSDQWDEDTENPVENNDCLFCDHHSRNYMKNVRHMTEAHSFFIPDPEYCTDIQGLLIYLGEKVYSGFMCLWCNDSGKAFKSAEAAKAHMIDKGHCKMLHEGVTLAEYGDFYDYSSSYPDAADANAEDEVEIAELDDGDYQLVLPSGSIIGHRSLMRYYKQSLNPNGALIISKSEKIKNVLGIYRALGWKNNDKAVIQKKARDIKFMQRVQSKYSTKLQFKANKFQPHFRRQVQF